MFDNLTDKFSCILQNISGHGKLTENNIKETLREVRMALLEADVAVPVVHKFVHSIKERSLDQCFNKKLSIKQELIKIVHDELVKILGNKNITLNLAIQPPAVILIIGSQGVGKTTTVAKLGKILKEIHKKKVLITSTDIYRAAAIDQLETLAEIAQVNFFSSNSSENPIEIATNAIEYAKLNFYDVLIIDTAGCNNVYGIVMKEIQGIHSATNPIETLFIVDAMIGQDAANIAKSFNEILPLTGIILTKVDGDSRGGAALSICHITGKNIKFLGTGEKINSLEPFYPERIASRILGMGDILSLIADIENKVVKKRSDQVLYKFQKNSSFDLNDFREQLKYMRDIGGISSILSKMPGIFQFPNTIKSQIDDKLLVKMEAMINSMTIKERQNPEIIKGARKRRIAIGSGTQMHDINLLLKQFYDIQRMMKKMKKGKLVNMIRGIKIDGITKFF